ncbi:SDR family oxidoreductase [Paraferrimonas haliotis]|uniref:SDR family oxidoreductase n=1 Tax=Paraferrimonas haliotis TaxID=2013866 RepID=UPI000BA96D7C|nr:SDR family oxidoreductase [Paraferrimonas haliotis]
MKTIFITGVNRGIGLEFCRQYLAQGWQVIGTCRNASNAMECQQLLDAYPKHMQLFELDVCNEQHLQGLKQTMQGVGIDVFINNAGVYGPKGVVLGDVEASDMAEVLQVNTIAPLMMVQTLLPSLVLRQGKIAIISSKMGSMGDNTSGGAYTYRASKAALNAIGLSLAQDLKDDDIAVAILHPGWVQTDMGGPNAWITTEQSVNEMIQQITRLDLSTTGAFINYDGQPLPW